MADTLDINEIEQSGATRLEVAKKTKELTALVERVFPGYAVYIQRRDKNGDGEVLRYRRDLSALSVLEQVETVLRESGAPMQKRDLFKEIYRRGGNVSQNTLSIYLSRYDRFVSHGNGRWWINPANYSNETEVSAKE
jgi:hypothetical protein